MGIKKVLLVDDNCTGDGDNYFPCELCRRVAAGTFIQNSKVPSGCWDVHYCRFAACLDRKVLLSDDVRALARAQFEDKGTDVRLEHYDG